ncbi:MAG: STAS domain-containing protein [Myxococcales bacterium]|nr:STAS domain-containing protein [Myxococcales bacterium]
MERRFPGNESDGHVTLDEQEVTRRRALFCIEAQDLARIAALRPLAERHMDAVVDSFYELLLGHPDTRAFFPDELTVGRVKRLQRSYFLGLFAGRCDLAYAQDRLRVGATHERIGMPPKWYIGAFRKYLSLLLERIVAEIPDRVEAMAAFESLHKLVAFDTSLAIDAYIAANLDSLGRQQAAIRELSTPVIRVHDRVLLLPLVGAIDSHRAQQVMETVLVRVIEDKARALILDIAGVPVVDTRVADHLLKTTAAVRLVGADTILTGVSAQVARTIIQLGVDISSMVTRARLSEGIEHALKLIGREIRPIGDKP